MLRNVIKAKTTAAFRRAVRDLKEEFCIQRFHHAALKRANRYFGSNLKLMIVGYGGIQGTVYRTPNLSVQFWHKGDLFATRDRFIFRSKDKGMSWEKVAKLALATNGFFGSLKDWVARLKMARRLRRMHSQISKPKLLIMRDETVLAAAEGICRGRLVEGRVARLKRVHKGPMMLHQGWTEDRKGTVFFGEYQVRNHTVKNLFWSHNKGKGWDIRYEFPRKEIRHIHAVA
jgi:hypothetical protein